MFKNEAAYLIINNQAFSMKKIVKGMSFVTLFLFGTYIILTGKTIYNIVNKKNIEQDIATTKTEIALLENNLFTYYNSIHKDSLPELGFMEYTDEVYVTPTSAFVFNQ